MKISTRFSPSPTGFLHSGAFRTALYNYLLAKKLGGRFYIRIEDTDDKRLHEKSVEYIYNSLDWCGLIPDDSSINPNPKYGEYFQSKRDYSEHIKYLLDNDYAYKAFDTSEELEIKKLPYTRKNRHLFKNSFSLSEKELNDLLDNNTPYVIRINIPENKEIILNDCIRGIIKFNSSEIDDKVLVKSNGVPTYHLAHVVDDHLMDTTHVLRGEEWIPSSPVHLLLWDMFKWEIPIYAHLSLILNPDGKGKLSKRNAFKKGFEIFPLECSDIDEKGDIVSFKGFKGLGYEPIAYLNFIALLGFNFGKDVLTMEEMIENFDLSKVNNSSAIFDISKLNYINREHLLKISNNELWRRFDYDLTIFSNDKLDKIMELSKERAITYLDLKTTIDIFFKHNKTKDISNDTKEILKSFNLDEQSFYEDIKNWINSSNINKKELREVLCSSVSGPELPLVVDIIGIKEFKKRILKYL